MIQGALLVIVILLVFLFAKQAGTLEALEKLGVGLSAIAANVARREEQDQKKTPEAGLMAYEAEIWREIESKKTPEVLQKDEEDEQDLRRRRVELDCGGWQTARILCRRNVEPLMPEYVLGTANRIYTVHGRMESFHRDGKADIATALQLDTEVRYAVGEGAGRHLGLLYAENPEGRILSLEITEEKVRGIKEAEAIP
jgi:hypothetical protein